jgi:hypothetical protein
MALPPVVYTPPSAATPPAPDAVFSPPAGGTPGAPGVVFTSPSATTPGAPSAVFTAPGAASPGAPTTVFSQPSAATPSAPGEVFAPPSAGAPEAPGEIFSPPQTPGSGVMVSGSISPNATGLLIDAGPGEISGDVHRYTSDGNSTPASSGRWTVLEWIIADGVGLSSYLDGVQDVGWYSPDAGAGSEPTIDIRTASNWVNYYWPEASGLPVVNPAGISPPPVITTA